MDVSKIAYNIDFKDFGPYKLALNSLCSIFMYFAPSNESRWYRYFMITKHEGKTLGGYTSILTRVKTLVEFGPVLTTDC